VERSLVVDLSQFIGRDWSDGFTCWSLVVAVYADTLGVTLSGYDTVPPTDPREVIPAARRFFTAWQKVPAGQEKLLDVILLDRATHCGIVLESKRMLHLERGMTSLVERYDGVQWASRVAGFYRLAS
jgi:hypothetical protein